jgi:hypothetical protein
MYGGWLLLCSYCAVVGDVFFTELRHKKRLLFAKRCVVTLPGKRSAYQQDYAQVSNRMAAR